MSKHLYLMRHGETLFNQRRRIQGWCDSPLTANGIRQAQEAKQLLSNINFDHYYSSTSERCCDTIEIVIGKDKPYQRLKQLKERNFGIFEGESEDLNPLHNSSFDYDDLFPHYGGEYSYEVASRMTKCLTDIMEKQNHQIVLAVSHAGASYSFFSQVIDEETFKKIGKFDNCNIAHFEYQNGKFNLIEVLKPQINK